MCFRKLKELKLLHVKWIAETYEYLKKQDKAAMKGFKYSRYNKGGESIWPKKSRRKNCLTIKTFCENIIDNQSKLY